MPVQFVATLRTARPLERGVSYHGATMESVELPARKWLESFGEAGDAFEIIENVPKRRALIQCDKPVVEVKRQYKGHAPRLDASGIRCDICGGMEEAHA